nr:enoyl-CoA hydratase-related protein [Actinomycetota bacterium]
MGDFTAIRVEGDEPVGRITLARPAKLNALSRAVLEELAAAAAWFDERPDVKVVVVAGEGRAFSAGFDLGDPTWVELGPPALST